MIMTLLEATSGYSRQHLARLITRFREHAPLGQRTGRGEIISPGGVWGNAPTVMVLATTPDNERA
jgi:hypothetical protein